jgi:hypothetical protein
MSWVRSLRKLAIVIRSALLIVSLNITWLFVGILSLPLAEGHSFDKSRQGIVALQSRSFGFLYTVENETQERVLDIDYFAPSGDRDLSCSALPQNASIPIFEQYGLISAELENAILDNFAIQLLNDQELTGRVFYAEVNTHPSLPPKNSCVLRITFLSKDTFL